MSRSSKSRFLCYPLLGTILLFQISCRLLQSGPAPTLLHITTPIPASSPTPALGKITGTLKESNGQPVAGITLKLWSISKTACPTETSGEWVQMQETKIEAKTDNTGAFHFENVPTGCYFLEAKVASSTPITMLRNDDGNIPVSVSAGQIVDIGEIPVMR